MKKQTSSKGKESIHLKNLYNEVKPYIKRLLDLGNKKGSSHTKHAAHMLKDLMENPIPGREIFLGFNEDKALDASIKEEVLMVKDDGYQKYVDDIMEINEFLLGECKKAKRIKDLSEFELVFVEEVIDIIEMFSATISEPSSFHTRKTFWLIKLNSKILESNGGMFNEDGLPRKKVTLEESIT